MRPPTIASLVRAHPHAPADDLPPNSTSCILYSKGAITVNQLPTRKKNRLDNYDYGAPGYYFVTVCIGDKSKLFWNDVSANVDPEHLPLTEYGKIVERFLLEIPAHYPNVRLDKYVVMPNHVHAIIQLTHKYKKVTISSIMRAWKALVTRNTTDLTWQKSFYDHVIRDERDYRRIWKYIDDNPIKWADDCYYV